jgi:hypothetical protein
MRINYTDHVKCFNVVQVPASTIFELVRKIHSAGPFIGKKYTRQNAVLFEEKYDKIAARFEHLSYRPDKISSTGTGFENSSIYQC